MMRWLIYTLFIVVFTVDFILKKTGLNIKILSILPEFLSLIAGAFVLLLFAINKHPKIRLRYWFFFFAFTLHIAIGIIGNHVQPLAVLAGMRTYLKFIPFFLLPLVCNLPGSQIRMQLAMLLFFGVIQLPLALYQRFFEYAHLFTGDYISGTLTAAPILTLYLIGTISVLLAFYLKKRMTTKTFIILIILLFIPTAINETKATVLLLPLALLIPTVYGADKEKRIKILMIVAPVSILLILGFNYAYQTFYTVGERKDAFSFFTSGQAEKYLYKGTQAGEMTGQSESEAGRIDAIIFACKENSKDFFKLVWGVGIGNAAIAFSPKFQGKYVSEYIRLGGRMNNIANFIWEIGILGIVHVIWFLLLIYLDSLRLIHSNDLVGALALGWVGVTAIIFVSLPYQMVITKNELIYPFSYFSGYLAAMSYSQTFANNPVAGTASMTG